MNMIILEDGRVLPEGSIGPGKYSKAIASFTAKEIVSKQYKWRWTYISRLGNLCITDEFYSEKDIDYLMSCSNDYQTPQKIDVSKSLI